MNSILLFALLFVQQKDDADAVKKAAQAHLEKEYPGLSKAENVWEKLNTSMPEDKILKKVAPDVTFVFAMVGNEYPVGTSKILRSVLAVSRDGKEVAEVRIAATGIEGKDAASKEDVIKFLNKVLKAGSDKAEMAAAAALLYPSCWHMGFGQSWVKPEHFKVKDSTAKLKTDGMKQPDQYEVEFDDKGQIKQLTAKDNRMHPICHEHRAAAVAFLRQARAEAEVRDVIFNDVTDRALPDHYLYEVVEGGRVVGFVLVRKGEKTCAYIDRATLKGLPGQDGLVSLLQERK